MRIFKVKTFARFTKRERIADASLCEAIEHAERGLVDVDLGRGLIKQRVARAGQGKRGGYRMLIAFRSKSRAVFCLASPKTSWTISTTNNWRPLRETAAMWLMADAKEIERTIKDGLLIEVNMTAKLKSNARLTKELLEMAKGMHASGIMNDAAYDNITMRHLGRAAPVPVAANITGEDIRAMRERANMSQAVFAKHWLTLDLHEKPRALPWAGVRARRWRWKYGARRGA